VFLRTSGAQKYKPPLKSVVAVVMTVMDSGGAVVDTHILSTAVAEQWWKTVEQWWTPTFSLGSRRGYPTYNPKKI
jgi:hypothetical protein